MEVMGQAIGEVEAAPTPETEPPVGVTPPGELKLTEPEQAPPVMVSPENATASEGLKVNPVPPPPQLEQVKENATANRLVDAGYICLRLPSGKFSYILKPEVMFPEVLVPEAVMGTNKSTAKRTPIPIAVASFSLSFVSERYPETTKSENRGEEPDALRAPMVAFLDIVC